MEIGAVAKARDIGLKGHSTYQWMACRMCGKERWVALVKHRKPHSDRCRRCACQAIHVGRVGPRSWAWAGGRRNSSGYIMQYVAAGHPFASMCVGGLQNGRFRQYVAEHRLVMATHLGRPLETHEWVHHKDGNRSNNAIENLELTSAGQHSTDHSKGYQHGYAQGYAEGLAAAQGASQ